MQKLTITSHKQLDALVAEKVMEGIESPYSLNIQSAWPVVEKMNEGCFNVTVCSVGPSLWLCEKLYNGIIDPQPTAPLAICLCALASVGIEVKLEIKGTLCVKTKNL